MGFSASTTPLEANMSYGQHPLFNYEIFSNYFNSVKLALLPENFSGVGGDRNEIIIGQGNHSVMLAYLERGYCFEKRPSMLVRIVKGDDRPLEESIQLPLPNEDETKDELTSRWVGLIHSRVGYLLALNNIFINWFDVAGDTLPSSEPPAWPNPDE
jgi:hypothetical protein